LLDFIDLVEDTFTPLVNQRLDLGDIEAARGAVQKLRTEPILERADMLAHHRLRQAQLARGAAEALFLDDLREDTHAFDTVHIRLPRFITCRDQSYAE
jgi:hypothetical protein